MQIDRRNVLTLGGLALLGTGIARSAQRPGPASAEGLQGPADHTLRIATGLIEVGPGRSLRTTTYNGQLPGPLLRLREGRPVTIDIHNDTDMPEQVHWHGLALSASVDGAAEEGTPSIPPHGMRRVRFTALQAGLRFYHTHLAARDNLSAGQYSGQVGALYIEPKREPGAYDQEVFLVLKELEPSLSRGGDMAMDFLSPAAQEKALDEIGRTAMKASLAAGAPRGYEVGYRTFCINGRMLGHGEPIRVKAGQRLLLHVINGSATEIRSLALPGHTFKVLALDGNPVPHPAEVPVLWLGTAERITAAVEMSHPGVWVLGDLADDDRSNGMGIVVEYAGQKGGPQWRRPPAFKWDYRRFTRPGLRPATPDEIIVMTFAKQNAAANGFNRWTINGTAFDMRRMEPMFRLKLGRRYRLRMRNASDDIHPMHLHRHRFEITRITANPVAGLIKDTVMLGGYQSMEIDFTADQPGLSLFHCHMQLHMDYGFMALFHCT